MTYWAWSKAYPLAVDQVAAEGNATGCGGGVSGGVSCRQQNLLADADGVEQREKQSCWGTVYIRTYASIYMHSWDPYGMQHMRGRVFQLFRVL